jgi:NAD(P)-dependent dehydrogenase (short-subunit alcohol dehydrogenase family)/HPt (histidine-containing phosphotransfer) domain-containing protein
VSTKDDRVVLITGGCGGMGRAIAARFLEAGAKIAVADLHPENIESGMLGIQADVTNVADCARMVRKTAAKFGRLDVLVAAAGIWTEGPSDAATEAEWDKVIDVNLKGVFFANRYAIPELEKTGGIIVNIASDAGLVGNAGAAIYCASKGGVVLLTKALAVELAPRGIRAVAICPGDVATPMLEYQASAFGNGDAAGYLENLRSKYPQKQKARFITAEEVAELVYMSASPRLGALTGAALAFDFGLSAGSWKMGVDRRPIDQMVLDVGGDAFQRLARLFHEETRGAVVALRSLLASRDWRELGRQAHSLKHSTASFGLTDLATTAALIETAADAQKGAEAEVQLALLERAVDGDLAELDGVLRTIGA